jgi:hypothetical protein
MSRPPSRWPTVFSIWRFPIPPATTSCHTTASPRRSPVTAARIVRATAAASPVARSASVSRRLSSMAFRMVFHAQRSYYEQLLRAGVKIYLYPAPAVLHAKHLQRYSVPLLSTAKYADKFIPAYFTTPACVLRWTWWGPWAQQLAKASSGGHSNLTGSFCDS